jgi:hypothetical protein
MSEKQVCRHCSKTIHRGGTYDCFGGMHKKCSQKARRDLRKLMKRLKVEVASIYSSLMLTQSVAEGQLKLGDSITIRIRRPERLWGEKP